MWDNGRILETYLLGFLFFRKEERKAAGACEWALVILHLCMCAVIQIREGSDQEEKLEELLAKLPTGSLRFDRAVQFLYLSECVPDA